MSTIDIILVVMLAVGGFSGYKQGLFIGLLSIVAFFFGIIVAFRFMHWGASILAEHVESLTFMLPFVSFLVIFFVVTAVIRIMAYLVKKALNLTILGTFDSFAGMLLGVFKWCVMISLVFWVAHAFDFQLPERMTADAVLYPSILPIAPTLVGFLDHYTPIIENTITAVKDLVNSGPIDSAD